MSVTKQGALNAFPAILRKPFSFVCPYCGYIHRPARHLWITAIIFIVSLLVLVSGIHPGRAGQPDRSIGYRAELRPFSRRSMAAPPTTSTPMVTSFPATTPTLTPTPLPIPTTGVIWNQENVGSYFWEAPGKGILSELPNGTIVTFLEEWQAYGGLGWGSVEFNGQAGWVDVVDVYRVALLEDWVAQVLAAEGTYLYSEPQGEILTWLPQGTPVMTKAEGVVQDVYSRVWLCARLLDGREGSVAEYTIESGAK